MAALGKLTAGLAHELNNPATAANQAAGSLQETVKELASLLWESDFLSLRLEQLKALSELQGQMFDNMENSNRLDALTRSDLEDELREWMAAHLIMEDWNGTSTLAQAALNSGWLDAVFAVAGEQSFITVITWFESILRIYQLAREIESSTHRLTEIVRAVRAYAFPNQTPQEFDLHESLENSLQMLGFKLRPGITVIREYDPQLPHITGFSGELSQVWTNLIDNAIDAMGGRGKIAIRTTHQDGIVQVEITDNGPGIPVEIQPRVFDPFFTTKQAGKGTGLGLEISHRIVVDRHRGKIELESRPGETRFRVRLPVQGPGEPA
jgi:signal transduction histidine kinase